MRTRSKITIKGLNQEKILNNLSKKIKIYNFRKSDDNQSEFEVDLKNKKKTKHILEQNNIKILSIIDSGILSNVKKILTSAGILCGLILGIIVYCLQYFFVWRVEVCGIENSKEIQRFIEDNLSSKLKYNINLNDMEILVKNQFEDVSSISMAIVGQCLLVNINETLNPEEMKESPFDPLISINDGLITQINLIQGTLNCKVGDIIKKGDILVYPFVIDSQGERREVNPKAEIYADVWLSQSITHYDYYLKRERTGKKIVYSQVLLNDKIIYDNKKDVLFKEYEIEKSEEILTKNLVFPFILRKTIFYEVETFEVSKPFDEFKDEIIENTRLKTLQFLQKNEIIKKEVFSIKQGNNFNQVNYTITVNRNIGG